MENIRSVFEKHCGHIKIDRRLVKRLNELRVGFVNRNEDHIEFFSGNLLGVNPVKYKTSDRDTWFDEILEVDESDIKEDIAKLESIDPNWIRANDIVNLSSTWLMYRIHIAPALSARDKQQGIYDVCMLLQYKFITSILSRYFPYPADKAVAMATYEALSRKFEIKQFGSWQALLDHRAKSIIENKSIHYHAYTKYTDDAAILRMVNDIQDRLRKIIKKMTAVFYRVKEQNLRISTTSDLIVFDGEEQLRDLKRDHSGYLRYLRDVITDKKTFIRKELIQVVSGVLNTMPERHLEEALTYCVANHGSRGDPKVDMLLEETLLHTYSYISDNIGVMASTNDFAGLVGKLKNIYMASRMSDPNLISMRDKAEHIVKKSVSSKNKAVLSAVRTGLQIYIVLRAFTKNHYQI